MQSIHLKIVSEVSICRMCQKTIWLCRQKETEKLSQEVDLMIIVGGSNSSNTRKLYDISIKKCKNAGVEAAKGERVCEK